jgi:ABC-type bacteriocin/lantibiotic exporter with double-glycine peptidase domain
MVTPIIDLAKRNIEHNAKKNEKFIELFTKCEELKAVTQNNHREIQEIRRSQKEI